MDKPKLTRARYSFEDAEWLWHCKGWGSGGYGETPEEAFEDWWLNMRLLYTFKPLAFLLWRVAWLVRR